RREFNPQQRAIQQNLQRGSEANGARELIFEIARRSHSDAAVNFDQALANARAAYEEGLKAIEAGARGGNLSVALEERTRERVPLDWAMTQNHLGNALERLGERESGTARLEEGVAAFRAALQEQPHEQVPLQWAATRNNLGF